MNQEDGKNTKVSTDNIRLVNKKNAKSIFPSDSENSIEKLQKALDQLDDIDKKYTEEEIQNSLIANNYDAPEDEMKVLVEEEESIETKKNIKEFITKDLLEILKKYGEKIIAYFRNLPVKIKRIIYGILGILVIIIFVLFIRFERKIHTYDIVINGDSEVSLYEGGLYKESGVDAYNYKGENKIGLVKIDAHVDTDVVGEYTIKYTIKSFWKKNEVTRKVIVLPNPLDNIYFTLNGDEEVSVKLGKEYEDAGYNIRSDDDEDYSKYVTVTNDVNTEKIGVYEVRYLIKINKKEQELVRKLNVVGNRYTIKYNKKVTRNNIELNIISNLNNFDYFVVEGHKVLKDNIIYNVSENGTYNFEMYDTDGKKDNISVKVTNIDREAPTGVCSALMSSKNNRTMFQLNVKDANAIMSYKYNGQVYTDSSFTINSIVSSGDVEVTDEAGNSASIGCKYLYAPIYSEGSNNVILRFDGSTLKYWVEEPTNTYLITHIWVEDSYEQFKVAIPREFPQLEKAGIIMNIASNKYGYYGKAMIGANASGFVTEAFNADIAKKYPQWKYSSKSPLVIVDGTVIRNYTDLDQVGGAGTLTYGIKRNGYFSSYYVNDPNNKLANQKNAQRAIDDGVRYTFAFGPYLIRGGSIKSDLTNSPDVRQAIGQIDKNNFVIVTNTVGINNRSSGFGYKSLANLMYNLGCMEAYNTDGGGSTNLIYKNRNTNSYSGIVTSTRDVADIMYFVEK